MSSSNNSDEDPAAQPARLDTAPHSAYTLTPEDRVFGPPVSPSIFGRDFPEGSMSFKNISTINITYTLTDSESNFRPSFSFQPFSIDANETSAWSDGLRKYLWLTIHRADHFWPTPRGTASVADRLITSEEPSEEQDIRRAAEDSIRMGANKPDTQFRADVEKDVLTLIERPVALKPTNHVQGVILLALRKRYRDSPVRGPVTRMELRKGFEDHLYDELDLDSPRHLFAAEVEKEKEGRSST